MPDSNMPADSNKRSYFPNQENGAPGLRRPYAGDPKAIPPQPPATNWGGPIFCWLTDVQMAELKKYGYVITKPVKPRLAVNKYWFKLGKVAVRLIWNGCANEVDYLGDTVQLPDGTETTKVIDPDYADPEKAKIKIPDGLLAFWEKGLSTAEMPYEPPIPLATARLPEVILTPKDPTKNKKILDEVVGATDKRVRYNTQTKSLCLMIPGYVKYVKVRIKVRWRDDKKMVIEYLPEDNKIWDEFDALEIIRLGHKEFQSAVAKEKLPPSTQAMVEGFIQKMKRGFKTLIKEQWYGQRVETGPIEKPSPTKFKGKPLVIIEIPLPDTKTYSQTTTFVNPADTGGGGDVLEGRATPREADGILHGLVIIDDMNWDRAKDLNNGFLTFEIANPNNDFHETWMVNKATNMIAYGVSKAKPSFTSPMNPSNEIEAVPNRPDAGGQLGPQRRPLPPLLPMEGGNVNLTNPGVMSALTNPARQALIAQIELEMESGTTRKEVVAGVQMLGGTIRPNANITRMQALFDVKRRYEVLLYYTQEMQRGPGQIASDEVKAKTHATIKKFEKLIARLNADILQEAMRLGMGQWERGADGKRVNPKPKKDLIGWQKLQTEGLTGPGDTILRHGQAGRQTLQTAGLQMSPEGGGEAHPLIYQDLKLAYYLKPGEVGARNKPLPALPPVPLTSPTGQAIKIRPAVLACVLDGGKVFHGQYVYFFGADTYVEIFGEMEKDFNMLAKATRSDKERFSARHPVKYKILENLHTGRDTVLFMWLGFINEELGFYLPNMAAKAVGMGDDATLTDAALKLLPVHQIKDPGHRMRTAPGIVPLDAAYAPKPIVASSETVSNSGKDTPPAGGGSGQGPGGPAGGRGTGAGGGGDRGNTGGNVAIGGADDEWYKEIARPDIGSDNEDAIVNNLKKFCQARRNPNLMGDICTDCTIKIKSYLQKAGKSFIQVYLHMNLDILGPNGEEFVDSITLNEGSKKHSTTYYTLIVYNGKVYDATTQGVWTVEEFFEETTVLDKQGDVSLLDFLSNNKSQQSNVWRNTSRWILYNGSQEVSRGVFSGTAETGRADVDDFFLVAMGTNPEAKGPTGGPGGTPEPVKLRPALLVEIDGKKYAIKGGNSHREVLDRSQQEAGKLPVGDAKKKIYRSALLAWSPSPDNPMYVFLDEFDIVYDRTTAAKLVELPPPLTSEQLKEKGLLLPNVESSVIIESPRLGIISGGSGLDDQGRLTQEQRHFMEKRLQKQKAAKAAMEAQIKKGNFKDDAGIRKQLAETINDINDIETALHADDLKSIAAAQGEGMANPSLSELQKLQNQLADAERVRDVLKGMIAKNTPQTPQLKVELEAQNQLIAEIMESMAKIDNPPHFGMDADIFSIRLGVATVVRNIVIPSVIKGDPLKFNYLTLTKKQLANVIKDLGDQLEEVKKLRGGLEGTIRRGKKYNRMRGGADFEIDMTGIEKVAKHLNDILIRATGSYHTKWGETWTFDTRYLLDNSEPFERYLNLLRRFDDNKKIIKSLEKMIKVEQDSDFLAIHRSVLGNTRKQQAGLHRLIERLENEQANATGFSDPLPEQFFLPFKDGEIVALYKPSSVGPPVYWLCRHGEGGELLPIEVRGTIPENMPVRGLRWVEFTGKVKTGLGAGWRAYNDAELPLGKGVPHNLGGLAGILAAINHFYLMQTLLNRTYKPGDKGPIPSWIIHTALGLSLIRSGKPGTGFFGALKASGAGLKGPFSFFLADGVTNFFFPVSEENPWGHTVDWVVLIGSLTPAAVVVIPLGLVAKIALSLNEKKYLVTSEQKRDFIQATEYLADLCMVRRDAIFVPREAAIVEEMQRMLDKGLVIKRDSPEWKKFFGIKYDGDGGWKPAATASRWKIRRNYGEIPYPDASPDDKLLQDANDSALLVEPKEYDNFMSDDPTWNAHLDLTWSDPKSGIFRTLAELRGMLEIYGSCTEARNQIYNLMYNVASRARLLQAINFWTDKAADWYPQAATSKAPLNFGGFGEGGAGNTTSINTTYPSIVNGTTNDNVLQQIYLNNLSGDWVTVSTKEAPGATRLSGIIKSGNFYHHMQKQIATDAHVFCATIQHSLNSREKPTLKEIYGDLGKVLKNSVRGDAAVINEVLQQNYNGGPVVGKQLITFNLPALLQEMCDLDKKAFRAADLTADAVEQALYQYRLAEEAQILKNTVLFDKWLTNTVEGQMFNKYNMVLTAKRDACLTSLRQLQRSPVYIATMYGQGQSVNEFTDDYKTQLENMMMACSKLNISAMTDVRNTVYLSIMHPFDRPQLTVAKLVNAINQAKDVLGEQPLSSAEVQQLVMAIDYKGDDQVTQLMQKIDQEIAKREQDGNYDIWQALMSLRGTLKIIQNTVVACIMAGKKAPKVDLTAYQSQFSQIVKQSVAKLDTDNYPDAHQPPPPPPGVNHSAATSCAPKCVKPSDLFTPPEQPDKQEKTVDICAAELFDDLFG